MKRLPLLLVMTAVLLAGCSDDDHYHHPHPRSERHHAGDGAIGLEGDTVVIEAGGQTALARVGTDGSLRIGDTTIDTGPDAQAVLKAYDAAAVAMKTHAIALGRTGADFGLDTLKEAMHGLFDGNMDEVGEQARAGARTLLVSVRELCTRMEAMHAAQQAAALAVPAFKPYAVLAADQVRECFEEIDEQINEHRDDDQPVPAAAPSSAPAGAAQPAPPDAA
ncbi:MAG: hypothetical protein Q8M37_07495 [Nevskia sp.]|nr:hypothetical protein [Nevskia sp.]